MPFSQETRTRALLWCDRHCCLCRKACGPYIEVHHIVPEADDGTEEIDNAIPLCFECHAVVQHYNADHPLGTKFKVAELKARREQVYEECTRHLVPPIEYRVTQTIPEVGLLRTLPDVGFMLTHLGDSLPVRIRIKSTVIVDRNPLPDSLGPHYAGEKLWRLNPRIYHSGHFTLPSTAMPADGRRVEIEVKASIIDSYEREHHLLPVGWVFLPESRNWYFEP